MNNSLYQSLLNRLKNKHAKLSSRFHKSVKEGEFQKQRYRKRKESIERIKSLEKRIQKLGKESGFKVALNYKHWAVALAMGAVVSASGQERVKQKFKERPVKNNVVQMTADLPLAQTVFFDTPFKIGQPYLDQLHTGDLDGDGDIDAVAISIIQNPIILFNEGGFTFTQGEIAINSTGFIEETRLADFDGDGDLDLFVEHGLEDATIFEVWLNDGSGNFSGQSAVFPTVETDEDEIRLADLDGDGDLDMVGETMQDMSPYYTFVTTFNNVGFDFTDTTAHRGSYVFSQSSRFVGLMDADGDNDIDILYTSYIPSNGTSLQFFENDGAGTFADAGTYLSLSNYLDNDMDTLDFDNDGDTDFIVSLNEGGLSLQVFENDGAGDFTEGSQITVPLNEQVNDLNSADFNGDNFDDFLITTEADSTFIFQGDGIGNFSELTKFAGQARPVELDNDGDVDLFYFDGDLSTLENQGGGTFAQGADIFNIMVSYDTDLIDIDEDGDLDLIQGSQLQSRIWANDGTGYFTVSQEIGKQGFSQEFGDLDGDGDPDMIRAIEEGSYPGLDIWTNAGGMLTYNQNIGAGTAEFKVIYLDTMDADADLDIIAIVETSSGGYLRTYLNNGGLSFSLQSDDPLFYETSTIAVGDLDGDFDVDALICYNNYEDGIRVILNNGTGSLGGGNVFNPTVTSALTDVDLFDADGDGDLDAFVTSNQTHQIWLNNGTGGFSYGSQITSSNYVYKSYVGDIDSDGDVDIILGGYATYPEIWVNDGSGNFDFDSSIEGIADEYAKVVLGDLDNDGDQDIVLGGYYVGTKVFINQAAAPGPEINVQGGGLDIASGDVTPDVLDGTDFGTFVLGDTPPTVPFTIQNTGSTDLTVSTVSLMGTNATDFAITNITTPVVVAGGGDVSFDLTFNPAVEGAKIANIEITSDDSDEATYTFDIAGLAQTPQEINVQGNGFDILSGDITPDVNDGTDFENTTVGIPSIQSFTIQNTGETDLSLSSITISGTNASDFAVTNIVVPSIISGMTDATFELIFTPAASGLSTATVEINNDDADESTYTFDVLGTGQNPPEINVQGNGEDILNEDFTPSVTDGTDFGTVIVGATSTSTFSIQNLGEAPLNVSSVGVLGGDLTEFTITNITPPVSVEGSNSVTFDVNYSPTTEATHTLNLGILSDDTDEPLYSFDLTGVGLIDPLVTDSLALVNFYNNNNGLDWADNANWLVEDQPLDTWTGISLSSTNDRIEIIELPNNGLSGTLSNDLNTLDALVTLDLSGNDIDALATDFSGLTSATSINLEGNRLDFGDLEAVAGVGALSYDNQQELNAINESGPILIPSGSTQELTTTINGTSNTYQWVLDGNDIAGETGANITISDIGRSNMGTYSLKVSNTIATGVTLTTPTIDVLATAVISVDAKDLGTDASITENVNAYLFEVNTGTVADTLDAATQLNVTSPFDFPAVVLGDFLVAVESVIPLTDGEGNNNDDANYIPTYYGDTFDNKEADTLELNNDVSIEIVMTDVPPELTEIDGQGVVSGTIEDDFGSDAGRIDARRRAAGRKCGLKKRRSGGRTDQEDIYDLIAYGETNANGEFEYGFLPEGTYRFFVEYPGIPLDESAFVQFDIGEAGVADDTFVLAVFASEEGIQIELVLGITSEFFTDFSIYPNPATDLLTIEYGESKGDLKMEIVSMDGKTVLTRSIKKDETKVQVDTSIIPSGQYLIKFVDQKMESNSLVYRLIKK